MPTLAFAPAFTAVGLLNFRIGQDRNALLVGGLIALTIAYRTADLGPAEAGYPLKALFFKVGGLQEGNEVRIGGVLAPLTSVSPTRIVGSIPASVGATDLLDVEVRVGLDSAVMPAAFRYLHPVKGLELATWSTLSPTRARPTSSPTSHPSCRCWSWRT